MRRVRIRFSEYGLLRPEEQPYPMTLDQIEFFFGKGNHSRRNVFSGLKRGVTNMFSAGIERIILGGSFISSKEDPSDADIAWWFNPKINWETLDAVFQVADRRPAIGKYLMDQKIDGVQEVDYLRSHERFLRSNRRVPAEFQEVGIVQIVLEKKLDYI